MRKFSHILCLLFSVFVFSQPILNKIDFPSTFSANALKASTQGYSNGYSGENVVWDYSSINLTSTNFSYNLVSIETAPHYAFFPTANYCYKFNDNGLLSYNFYKLNDNSFELLGYSEDKLISAYTNSSTFLVFPYTYNSVINDDYQSSPSSSIRNITRTYDGYGTLKTPFGNFENVIRQKEIGANGGTTYYWIATNPYQIILSGNFDNPTIYFYQDSTNLNIPQNTLLDSFNIYPNPSSSEFTIETSAKGVINVQVFDMTGRLVEKADTNRVGSRLAAGIYNVIVTQDTKTKTVRVIKK
jgi:hypothetical protein